MELPRQPLVVHPRYVLDIGRPLPKQRLELTATDDLEAQVGGEPGRLEHRRQPVQRDQLADEERLEGLLGLPAGAEDPLLGADEADLDFFRREASELGQKRCVRLGVGDDEVGRAERVAVDRLERASGKRFRPEAPAIPHKRVVERDERVEDDRSAGRNSPGGSEVEMPGVTDDQRIEVLPRAPEEPRLGERQPGRRLRACAPLVRVSLPDGDVALADRDAGTAKSRDHLRVSRIVALVRAEVEDAHFARVDLASLRALNGFARASKAHPTSSPRRA